MYLDFYQEFQGVHNLKEWTVESLANYFDMPAKCFAEVADGVILVIQKWAEQAIGYLMRGSIFFTKERIAIRGMPKIMYGRIYQAETPAAVVAERELLSCLKEDVILFEEKLDGVNIRMYQVGSDFYFATRMKYNGISEKGDVVFGELARGIVDRSYPKAYALAEAGYVPIFEMLSPRFDYLTFKAKEDDLFLIDVLQDNKFLRRENKEELAEKYELKVPRIISRIDQSLPSEQFLKEIKSLEYYCRELGIEGVVAKAFKGDSDQVFLKIKTQDVRMEHWGAMGIPKRFIMEVIRGMKAELSKEEFVDRDFGLNRIIEELSDDFIISDANRPKIEQYYEEEREKVLREVEAKKRAEKILREKTFSTRKQLAVETQDEEDLVRHNLFELWSQQYHE